MTPRLLRALLVVVAVLAGVQAHAAVAPADSHAAAAPVIAAPAPVAPVPAAAPKAAAPAAVTLTPTQAQQAIDVLQDPAKRTQLLQVLQTIAKVVPATPAGRAAAAAIAGPPTLVGEVVQAVTDEAHRASREISVTTTAVANFPLLYDWLVNTFRNPAARAQIVDATWRMLLVLGCGVLGDWTAHWLLRKPRQSIAAVAAKRFSARTALAEASALEDAAPRHARTVALMRRLPRALLCFLLDLLGPLAFALVTYVALGLVATDPDTRQIVLVMLNAYLLARVTLCATRLVLAPWAPALRLLRLSDGRARQAMGWARRLVVTATFGPALTTTAQMLGLYQDAADAVLKLIGLVFACMLVDVVLRLRGAGAALIRGHADHAGAFYVVRNRFAMFWHVWAIVLIAALWFVWAFQVQDGLTRVLHLFLTTALVLVVARVSAILLFGLADRLFSLNPELTARYPGLQHRASRYAPIIRRTLGIAIGVVSVLVLLQLWGIDALGWFDSSRIGARLVSAATSIALVALATLVLWEVANALLDGQVAHHVAQAQPARAARLRTLAPILRTSLLVVILVFLLLTIMSELGVNTAPLLAGASIFGVALGFGSQKLVQDFITGIFLLLENAMQVGDWVTVSGLSGAVENLSIRTIRLRAGDGSVHIIPFSSVTSVTNVNRGIGNAAIGVAVAAAEDTDRVSELLKGIGAELRDDPTYGPMILSDLALWGIDKVDGSGITISGQIECTDGGRWGVQREFNRRMKRQLQSEGIQLAVPVQTTVVQYARDRPVPPSGPEGAASVPAASEVRSPPPQALGNTS